MMPVLTTIGYEGASLDDFIATLKAARVHTLIDVRELPISRRRGFAKNALSSALEDEGIRYVHLKGLGDPKEGREAARAEDFDKFLRIYRRHLKTPAAQKDLAEALRLSADTDACLMCYERDYKTCHRLLVAEAIADIVPTQIRHLGVRQGLDREKYKADRTGHRFSQGATSRGQEAR
jgi:uncharacterized protein (DUF488 family)